MRKISVLCGLTIATLCIGSSWATPASAQAANVSVQSRCVIGGAMCPGGSVNYSTNEGTYVAGSTFQLSSGAASPLPIGTPTTGSGLASARTISRADFGVLGGAVDANLPVGFGGQVLADTQLNWSDIITVRSASLESNSPVRIRFTSVLDVHDIFAEISRANEFLNGIEAASYISFQGYATGGGGAAMAQCFGGSYCSSFVQGATGLSVGRNIFTREYDWRVDAPLAINEQLYVGVFLLSTNGADIKSASGAVDAFHTARGYVEVLTPGATLTSASGHDYSLPSVAGVPEPASWAMMITGFGFVGGAMRSAKARRSRLRRAT